jgi:hypothetical protein
MQIDYTSRDFNSLKADLISLISNRTNTNWNPTDYNDLGNVLVEAFAYMGDIMSHYLDRTANESTIDTAIQRSTLLSLAAMYDYIPSGPTPASVQVSFTNISNNTISLPIGTQVMAPLSYGAYAQVYFETTQAAIGIVPNQTITLPASEGKTVNTDRPDQIDPTYNVPLPANLGSSNGLPNQSFTIIDSGVINASINVYVGQGVAFSSWTYADNLLEWGSLDKVFTVQTNVDGTISIVFGDNVHGAIPPSGQLISCLYRISTGAAGNVNSLAISEMTFVPGNLDPQVTTYFTVSNSLPASGGADADDQTMLKQNIKAAVSSLGRAVTLQDYSNLALQVPLVGKANSLAGVYSSITTYIQPMNDNSAAPGFPQASIVGVSASGGVVTYATNTAHGFSVGNTLNISGVVNTSGSPTYNLQGITVASVPTSTTFTVSSSATGTYSYGGLAISLTPTLSWYSLQSAVQAAMADQILVGTTLTVSPPTYVPIYLTSTVTVQPSYKNADIKAAIYQAMLGSGGLFQYDNNTFGASIPLSLVTTTIQNIPGVLTANITQFCTDGSSSVGSITLAANQIPYLTAASLVSNVSGGI